MDALSGLLLHIGHADNAIEVSLTVAGFVLTLVGVGLAVMALWPRQASAAGPPPQSRTAQRRALRQEDGPMDEEKPPSKTG